MNRNLGKTARIVLAIFLLWMCVVTEDGSVHAAAGGDWDRGSARIGAIAAGSFHSLALKRDGTVQAWGKNDDGQAIVPSDLNGVKAVAAGSSHSLALKANGEVVAWGKNDVGQINVPIGLSGVVAIAANGSYSLALKSNGEVVAWGSNSSGQTAVPAGLNHVIAIAAGNEHALALKSDGTLVSWGSNTYGESAVPPGLVDVVAIAAGDAYSLALKSNGEVVAWGKSNVAQTSVPSGLDKVVAIAAGEAHALALKSDGSVVIWGSNQSGQAAIPAGLNHVVAVAAGKGHSMALQLDDTIMAWGDNGDGQSTAPGNVSIPVKAKAISGGGSHSMALRSDGIIDAWGRNDYGESTVAAGLTGVAAIAAGRYHSVALKSDGTVVVWGHNIAKSNMPTDLDGVVKVDANGWYSMALQSDGTVRAWGSNSLGQTNVPAGLSGVVDIAAGTYHALALKSDGTIAAWGNDSDGQVSGVTGLSDVVAVAAGGNHSLALKSDGTVVAWGSNSTYNYGQTAIPAGLSNAIAVAAGEWHSLALKSDGTVVAWGNNDFGQSTVPAGLNHVVAIAAGYGHSMALKADGTVVAWGDNADGETNVPGNANLSDLSISTGALSPSFAPSVTSYTYQYVGASTATIAVTAMLTDSAHAALLIDGQVQPSGTAVPVSLSAGSTTTVPVRVEPYIKPGKTYAVTVRRDSTPPLILFGTDGNESHTQSASTTVAVTDTESGLDTATLEYAWSADTTEPTGGWSHFASGDTLTAGGTNGDTYLHIRARDRVGNVAHTVSNRFRLDNAAPNVIITMVTADGNAYMDNTWTSQEVTVRVNAADAGGITDLTYSADGGTTWHGYTSEVQLQNEGEFPFFVRAVDSAGNVALEQRTVKISKTGLKLTPTLVKADGSSYTSGTWTNAGVTASVYAEAGASGIASLTYMLDGGVPQSYVNNAPIRLQQEGKHALLFRITDTAGNTASLPLAVHIDETPSTVAFGTDGSESWAVTASTSVTVSDAGSGVSSPALAYAWAADTTEPSAGWKPFANGSEISFGGVDGDRYLHVRAQDAAGNAVHAVSNRFRLDQSTAELGNMMISAGTLNPVFAPGTIQYAANVANEVSSIRVTPAVIDETDTVSVSLQGGLPQIVPGGQASPPLSLDVGANTMEVRVTALNGAAKTYTVTVTRAAASGTTSGGDSDSSSSSGSELSDDAQLQSLQVLEHGMELVFTPAFRKDLLDYQVQTTAAQVEIRGQAENSQSTVSINGRIVTGGVTVPLDVGDNRNEIVVKSVNGISKTYVLTIHRTKAEAGYTCPFIDLKGHWAEKEVCEASKMGIVMGISDISYEPDRYITRAEFTVMLVRAMKIPTGGDTSSSSFTDARDIPKWAKSAVAAAAARGISEGYPDGKYYPQKSIDRTELSAMLARAIRLETEGSPAIYADDADIPLWGKPHVYKLKQLGILSGYGDNRFWTKDYTTRAQAGVALLRLLKLEKPAQ
ncbi:cadherin-like beta sandwich domain-containing protein [Paenibacillus rigui]|uniref:SLH domain-containing protein n=1 Tax=Paenibacillus rigui TaxID=554312 RepID=A0A229UGN4_9BACL|nr:cadherin-like beta sandwich domain-containing protein [Paenibacillus rigui]OXM82557.1 hypothetical protein CF651_30190 [Paenibacillus rigui]